MSSDYQKKFILDVEIKDFLYLGVCFFLCVYFLVSSAIIMYILSSNKALKKSSDVFWVDPEDIAGNQCKVQLEVLYLVWAIPNQFHNLLQILYHFDNLPWVWKVAIQKGCHSHHQYHHNLGQRNYWNCPIQKCFLFGGVKSKGGNDDFWDEGRDSPLDGGGEVVGMGVPWK